MPDETCPSCGKPLPSELGLHAMTLGTGLVNCPHCGESVTVPRPSATEEPERAPSAGGEGAEGAAETFSGHETVEGVMEEIRDKEGE